MKAIQKKKNCHLLWHTVFLSLLLISLSALISACGSLYPTEYRLEPPTTQQGQMCVMQCEQNRTACKNDVKLAQKDCEHHNELARMKLESCIKAGGMSCYDSRKTCPPLSFEQCNKEHRYCYQACGGKVSPQPTCVDSWGWGLGCN
ncbi:hypothetical protein VU04_08660 [Desulfobulbus sp. TB]|nr:hypothetical protein [Desulfobulbus sp. TB]